MKISTSFAPGKVIVSGEYAVIFGLPGLAVPSSLGIKSTLEQSSGGPPLSIQWTNLPSKEWQAYAAEIVRRLQKARTPLRGRLTIDHDLPLGKGMGASTALIVALSRAIIGEECKPEARSVEDALNKGHSGIDFATIWNGKPTYFMKGMPPRSVDCSHSLLHRALLIDTGLPRESTPELVAWIRSREKECREALETIGRCTERMLAKEDPIEVFRDHHKAQVALGVVPKKVQSLIAALESAGGAAKVIGAGGRTGGGGMVLAIGTGIDRTADGYATYLL